MSNRDSQQSDRRRLMLLQLMMAGTLILATLALFPLISRFRSGGDEIARLTNLGKYHYERGETDKALEIFQQALKLNPTHQDTLLNLANAYLLANQTSNALRYAQEVLNLDVNSAAAHYVLGCAHFRDRRFAAALQAFQQAKDADPTVGTVTLQLGRAHQELGHLEDAISEFQELVGFEPEHPVAHFALSQVLAKAGRANEAQEELKLHQQVQAKQPGGMGGLAAFERCKHTEIRIPFRLEQPDRHGIQVVFTDATASALGASAANYHGPLGVIDLRHDGRNGLFVMEGNDAFRLLANSNGVFVPQGEKIPAIAGTHYRRCLVAELAQDRFEDVVVLGDKASHAFKFVTNAGITEVTRFSGLKDLSSSDGTLVDMDFTGKLDLYAVQADGTRLRAFRNLGGFFFKDHTATSGLPATVSGARQILQDDWNNDDLPDLFVARDGQPPLLLSKTRGGPLTDTNSPADWPIGSVIAVGDLNNDLRTDLLVGSADKLTCVFNGLTQRTTLPLAADFQLAGLHLCDYDNDGWLDLLAVGANRVQVWRNLGSAGFADVTQALGLDKFAGKIEALAMADFDLDGDTDLLVSKAGTGLQLWRNNGGNTHQQFKLRLLGNRSNPSGIGIRLELQTGGLRLGRQVTQLPIEIGVGKYAQVDSLTVRWFDLAVNSVEIKVNPKQLLAIDELVLPTGSCPYLYAWDGQRFRFVTDLLGAAPAGLPVAEGRYVEADTDEFVWIGDETMFPAWDGNYTLQLTEELREVLYLDEAKLVVVDHPAGTEVHSTSKMLPGQPFPKHEILTLHNRIPLARAVDHEGGDVTARLQDADGQRVSPAKLRAPQLRGLAEPGRVTLDFGPLPVARPLVLALTGWLRFGGGMANMAVSHHADLPFPFPKLEAQDTAGLWHVVEVQVGVPAGKTKTILVDLTHKLPLGCQRLRLSTAFELHWDRIALFEKRDPADTRIASLAPSSTDLHWRGYSDFADLPWTAPLTPVYENVRSRAPWRITPSGWATRYGEVDELIAAKDNALAIVAGGDELTLRFHKAKLPPKSEGMKRDFFLFSVGWDKDSDFHVAAGTTIEPIPWHGMDGQLYGRQSRPAFTNDDWIARYNTRWVGPYTLVRKSN